MNSDIRVLITFRNNRKRKKLDIAIGENSAGYLIDLWIGAAISRPDGILTGWDNTDIALEANYQGDIDRFVNALLDSRWIEKDESGVFVLRNWKKRQKWAANEKLRSAAASKKALRRWVMTGLPKKDHTDFNVWFYSIYDHSKENNATSIQLAYKQYANCNSQHTTGNAPSPSPSPLPLPKDIHGTFDNVLLTEEEYNKLKDKFNGNLQKKINALSEYMKSKGKKYSDHYATILVWERKGKAEENTTEDGWVRP